MAGSLFGLSYLLQSLLSYLGFLSLMLLGLADVVLKLCCHLLKQMVLCDTIPNLLFLSLSLGPEELFLLLELSLKLLNLSLVVPQMLAHQLLVSSGLLLLLLDLLGQPHLVNLEPFDLLAEGLLSEWLRLRLTFPKGRHAWRSLDRLKLLLNRVELGC